MGLIRQVCLSALELVQNAKFHFVNTLAPSFLHQSLSYLYRMFMTIICRMISILTQFGVIGPDLGVLDFTEIALFCLVYTLESVNLKQS